jgi:O-antigen/teichoic acid export membrane protein
MKILNYFKGAFGLVLVAILFLLAIVFFFFFNSIYAMAVAILAIVAILVLPYYFGRKNSPEEAGNYNLKKVKE